MDFLCNEFAPNCCRPTDADPGTSAWGEVPAGHPFCAVVIDDTSFEVFRKYCQTACGMAHACPLREKVALVRFDMKTYTAAAAPSHLVDLCGFM